MTTTLESDSGFGSEDDFQTPMDLACNCELCHARMYVSMRNGLDDDYLYFLNQSNMGDGFHLLSPPSSLLPFHQQQHQQHQQTQQQQLQQQPQQGNSGMIYSNQYPYSYVGELHPTPCSPFGKCGCYHDGSLINDDIIPSPANYNEGSGRMNLRHDFDSEMHSYFNTGPQVYSAKEGTIHIRLSNYVALELSCSAYRLINYRNNSSIALSDNGEYGYVYHYNCRGLINLHHQKISVAFDKDRQVLLRNEKPSFVKKEMEFYRLTAYYWSACRPVSMENFDKDRTPDILKKVGNPKVSDEAKLKDLITSSVMHVEGGALIKIKDLAEARESRIYRENEIELDSVTEWLPLHLGDAKVEHKVNGDVQLNWFHEDRANCMIMSPLAGTFSLSTKNLEIITTPKTDIYISFTDFFVHVNNQQMTVSNGTVTGKCASESTQSSVLHLNSLPLDQQYYLPSHGYPQHPQQSYYYPPQQCGYKNSKRPERSEGRGDDKENDTYDMDFKSDTDSVKG